MPRVPTSHPHSPDYPTWGVGVLDGIQERISVPAPGAGSEWKYTVPGGYWLRLVAGASLFTTSAVVASRVVTADLTDGNSRLFTAFSTQNQAAGNACRVSYTMSFTPQGQTNTNAFTTLAFPYMWLPSGYTIQSRTVNIDVGDTYTLIELFFEALDESQWRAHIEHHRWTDAHPATGQHQPTAPTPATQGG